MCKTSREKLPSNPAVKPWHPALKLNVPGHLDLTGMKRAPCALEQHHCGAEDLKMRFPQRECASRGHMLIFIRPCNLDTRAVISFL